MRKFQQKENMEVSYDFNDMQIILTLCGCKALNRIFTTAMCIFCIMSRWAIVVLN